MMFLNVDRQMRSDKEIELGRDFQRFGLRFYSAFCSNKTFVPLARATTSEISWAISRVRGKIYPQKYNLINCMVLTYKLASCDDEQDAAALTVLLRIFSDKSEG